MAVVDYTEAEQAAALRYLRERRSLRAAWKVQGHLRSDQYLDEIEGLLPLSRVMRILRQVFLPVKATPWRVQKQGGYAKSEGREAPEFTTTGFGNDSSNVASIR